MVPSRSLPMIDFILATALLQYAHTAVADTCMGDNSECVDSGYHCVEGSKDYKSIGIFPDTMLDELPWFEVDNVMNEHCDCGENFIVPGGGHGMTGVGCNVMFQICPDDTVCFHGAPCQKGADNNYVCDCSMTIYPADKMFVGKHCEYEVTTECDYSDMEYDLSNSEKWVCANGGKCVIGSASPSHICECPINFAGHHCEFKGNAPICDLDCFNGGICTHGVQNYDDRTPELIDHFKGNSYSDMHCICPKGFTGPQCETKTSGCGNTECLNGGICENPIISGGDEFFYCDCREASNDKESNFAGSHCQSASTISCLAPSGYNPQDFFCTNNGECPSNYWEPCSCPVDYSGPRCEFLVQHHKDCSLECMNGGTCFHGHETSSTYDLDNMGDEAESNTHVHMHCKCPAGFIGNQCDISIEICNEYNDYCLNGGKCVSSGSKYVCECPSEGSNAYAGIHCEHIATSICGDTSGSFCTNDGICNDIVSGKSEHPGCTCVNGFHGNNCELSSSHKVDIEVVVEDIMWIYLVVLLVISSTFLFLICVKIRKDRLDQLSTTRAYLPDPEQEVMHNGQIT